jgi:hypothetical protein
MKSTQVRSKTTAPVAANQSSTSPTAPLAASQRALLVEEVMAQSPEQWAGVALKQFDNPAARPVFREWLKSIRPELLLNLVGALACARKNPKLPAGSLMLEWICARAMQLPAGWAGNNAPGREDDLHLLIGGDTTREPVSGLWAAADGRLFLWEQPEGLNTARAVDCKEALAWLKANHGDGEPRWLTPVFPENSAADELIYAANEPTRRRNATNGSPAAKSASCDVPFLEMEHSLDSTLALLQMLATARMWQLGERPEATGYCKLAEDCAKELHETWQAAHAETRAFARGERSDAGRAAVMLQLPVAKACGLLEMLGGECEAEEHQSELRAEARSGETAPLQRTGHILLARTCAAKLRAAYDAAFAGWQALDKAREQRAAA